MNALTIVLVGIFYVNCNGIDYTACGKNTRIDRGAGIERANNYNPPGTWPWMVSMGKRSTSEGGTWSHQCGGSLVTLDMVLTAANCLLRLHDDIQEGLVFIRAGDDQLQQDNDDRHVQVIQVAGYETHPDYQGPQVSGYSNAAILRLASPVDLTAEVRTICLPEAPTLRIQDNHLPLVVTGWGEDLITGQAGANLHDAPVQVYPEKYCNDTHLGQRNYEKAVPQGFTSDLFCGGDNIGGKGICYGDSGNPAVFLSVTQQKYIIKGIVSGGLSCGTEEHPNIYVRVSDRGILQWIYHQIGKTLPTSTAATSTPSTRIAEVDKACSVPESCKKRKNCESVRRKYTAARQASNTRVKKKLIDELKSIVCNKKEKAFCCPRSECALVPQVPHSTYSLLSNSTVKYTCNQDYIMDGDPIVVCRDGTWSPTLPSCRSKSSIICENEPCHKSALCSPVISGFRCQCKKGETGDPYGAGCLPETRFVEVLSSDLRGHCGFKTDSSPSKHVQCGSSVSALDAPWQVSILHEITRRHHCGGILVSKEHVITAAHCFQSTACNLLSRRGDDKCEPKEFLLLLGRSNATILYPSRELLDDVNSVTKKIEELYIHPEWQHANRLAGGNDIAILKIRSVSTSLFIKPACLPDPSKHFSLHQSRGKLEITGFGKNNSNSTPLRRSIPHELQLAEMRIIDKLTCDSKLRGKVAPDLFCTVPANDDDKNCLSKPGSCEGDSGGPGVAKDIYGQYVAIGIVAGGPPCGEDESVHPHHMTSVSHHLEFILKHMEKLPCPPPLGAPIPPTCNLEYVQFVSDLRCFDKIDCPDGARCFEYSCTLYQDDDQARLARTNCTTSQQCLDGEFECDVKIKKCNPQVASNGTIVHIAGGIQILNVPSTASQGFLPVFQEASQRSSCYGSEPCTVRTADDQLICKKPHCNRLQRCWCPYPVDLLYNLRTGQFDIKRG